MVANGWMVQFLADILNLPVDRPQVMETTALGAACLAGMGAGLLGSCDELADRRRVAARFEPAMDSPVRERLLAGWHDAVAHLLGRGE